MFQPSRHVEFVMMLSRQSGEPTASPEWTWDLSLGQILDPNPPCVFPDTPVREVLSQLAQSKPRQGYVLVARSGRLEGIFTERDALRLLTDPCFDPSVEISISEVMVTDPVVVRATDDQDLSALLEWICRQDLRYVPVLDPEDQLIGVLSSMLATSYIQAFNALKSDHSQLTIQVELLRAALAKANQNTEINEARDRLNFLKDDFLSTISHELRTPITAIQLALHMLEMASSEEKKQQYLRIAIDNSNQQRDIINDLLDAQRLDADSYSLQFSSQWLPDWIEATLSRYIDEAASTGHTLRIHADAQLQELGEFQTDYTALCRILRELIRNACKYSPADTDIDLSIDRFDSGIRILVENVGTIAPEEIPLIFKAFYRIPGSDRWKQKGMGLGLALVKGLVKALNGTIEVSSLSNKTQFSIVLPAHTG